jgi:subtilase family serine protease
MRISTTHLALLILALVMVACTSGPTSYPSITMVSTSEFTSLPDLTIKLMYLEMEGRQSNCVEDYTPYGIRVLVENIGLASAGSFAVDLNGVQQQVNEGLEAGQLIELHFSGTVPSGQYKAIADVTNQVVEQQEDNNFLSFLAPTPTPPPLCTATPIPTRGG